MKIDKIDTKNEVLVIAEIGNNHEGNLEQAIKLVRAVATTGAQIVKFQTFITELYVSPENPQRFNQLKGYELSQRDFREIARIAKEEGLIFMSTPFDLESARFLNELVPAFKIGSGENTFYPLLELCASFAKPIIFSTGCADLQIIEKAINIIANTQEKLNATSEIGILHCVTSYPAAIEDCNLLSIVELQKHYANHTIGYSDHSLGNLAAMAAVTLGAEIIEKHFTIDKNYSNFHDHKISATPDELANLVSTIKELKILLGEQGKKPRECELKIEDKIRRAICVNKDLKQGTVLQSSDICWTRPLACGLPPGSEDLVIGKKLINNLDKGQRVLLENLNK
jgi:N,N'-diacetyllegionaminate synthase